MARLASSILICGDITMALQIIVAKTMLVTDHSKSLKEGMGDTGFEPVTPAV